MSKFTDKPLSTFVVIAWILSGLQVYFCIDSIISPSLQSCDFAVYGGSVDIVSWMYVQIAFAGVNFIFAPWFQHQVWKRIMGLAMLPGGMSTQSPSIAESACCCCSQPSTGSQAVAPHVVHQAFKDVILYDLGVLFYFFALVASFFWSWEGGTWMMGNDTCDTTGTAGWAYYMGLCFFWVTFIYSMSWYCCPCCANSVELSAPIASYGPMGGYA